MILFIIINIIYYLTVDERQNPRPAVHGVSARSIHDVFRSSCRAARIPPPAP